MYPFLISTLLDHSTSFFSNPLSTFFLASGVANVWSRLGLRSRIGQPVRPHRRLIHIRFSCWAPTEYEWAPTHACFYNILDVHNSIRLGWLGNVFYVKNKYSVKELQLISKNLVTNLSLSPSPYISLYTRTHAQTRMFTRCKLLGPVRVRRTKCSLSLLLLLLYNYSFTFLSPNDGLTSGGWWIGWLGL